jgi:hypothetical protein
MFQAGTQILSARRRERKRLASLQIFITNKNQSDDASYAVFANLIFPINFYGDTLLKKYLVRQRAANFLNINSDKSTTTTNYYYYLVQIISFICLPVVNG